MSAHKLVVVVKASYLSELRRISYDSVAKVHYGDLYSKLSDIFNLRESFHLSYIDDDDDELTVANDYDLMEAVRYFELQNNGKNITVRLTLKKDDQKPAQAQLEPSLPVSPAPSDGIPANMAPFNFSSGPQQKPQEETPTPVAQEIDEPATRFTEVKPISPASPVHLPVTPAEKEIPNPVQTRPLAFAAFVESMVSPKAPAESLPQQSEELVTHNGVMCDCCFSIIRGMRWKCNDCGDYDLCQGCKSNNLHTHPSDHSFYSIPHPRGHLHSPVNFPRSGQSVYHAAQCDFCDKLIKGIRHKCINCPDFDLCDACIALAATQHADHTFMQIPKPGHPEIKLQNSAAHTGVRCDGCQKAIHGVRYKCVNCLDFDLCGNCEALTKHDPAHVFLKVKRPFPGPISTAHPLLPNLYSPDFCSNYSSPRIQRCAIRQSGHGSGSMRPAPAHAPYRVHPGSRCQSSNGCKCKSPGSCSFNPLVAITAAAVSVAAASASAPLETSVPATPKLKPAEILIVESKPEAKSDTKIIDTDEIETIAPVAAPVASAPVVAAPSVAPTEIDSTPVSRPESAAAASSGSSPNLYARFIEDINIPDGSVMQPRARFLKIWKMVNDGEDEWPQGTELIYCGGDHMFAESLETPSFTVPATQPTKEVFMTADLQAPAERGRYVSYWRLVAPDGSRFGHRVWCDIVVEQEDVASSTSSSMIFPRINAQPSVNPSVATESVAAESVATESVATESVATESVATESLASESAPGSPRTTASSAHPILTEDPFLDPPSYASSLAYSDRTPAGSVRSLPNESDEDDDDDNDESDASSQYSAVSSDNDESDNTDFIVVEHDQEFIHNRSATPSVFSVAPSVFSVAPSVSSVPSISSPPPSIRSPAPIRSSVSPSPREVSQPSPRLIVEEEDQEDVFGTQSEMRPLMETFTTANMEEVRNVNAEEVVVNLPTPYAVQMQTLREMGFPDEEMNRNLLAAYNGNIELVLPELLLS